MNVTAQSSLSDIHTMATNHLQSGSYDSAVHYFKIQDSISWAQKDSALISDSKSFFAQHYLMIGDHQKTIAYCKDLFDFISTKRDSFVSCNLCASAYQKVDANFADSLYRLGISLLDGVEDTDQEALALYSNYASFLRSKGQYTEAIDYYLKVVDLQDIPLPRAHIYLSLTKIYRITDNIERAREMMDQAILICDAQGYSMRATHVAYTNATILWREKKYEEAFDELDISIEAFKSKNQNSYLRAIGTRARINMDLGNWKAAAEDLIFIKESGGELDKDGMISIFLTDAKLQMYRVDYQRAIILSNQALAILQDIEGETDRLTAYKILHRAHASLGNTSLAYDYLLKKEMLADSLYRIGQSQQIAQLESLHKRKEQKQRIASLENEDEMKSKVLVNQRRTLFVASGALALITLLCLFLYRLYRKVNQQREVITKALGEKDLLLREIHHRVKNNLQMVSSLLTMQGRAIDDEIVKKAIDDGKNRVRSMSLIHQDLYNQENLTEINVRSYIDKLANELFHTYEVEGQDLSLQLDIEEIDLDVDIMIPLGLILNELVTNSLKYAFPNGNNGVLKVMLKQSDGTIELQVSDDGVGYRQDEIREDAFGSILVSSLTEQLEGTLNINTHRGTKTTIVIPFVEKV